MIWLRVASSGAIADAASVLVNAMDQRQGSRRRNSRSNLATTWEGDRARKGSAPSLSGLHLGTTLADKFSSLHNRPTTESAGNNRDDRSLELKHAGDSTATDLKTLDFPARSEFLLATGVYWIPLYEILEERGFEVLLVNARDVHNVRGRKSDVSDCEWLRELHSVRLLRASFRPAAAIVPLRSYLRQRATLVEEAATRIQRMQKALTEMNLKLHTVLTDLTGQTGLKIVRSILNGERDAERLAAHRDHRCHASHAEIAAALTGNYRAEHLFALRQNFAAYEFLLQQITECDAAIEKQLSELAAQQPPPSTALLAPRRKTSSKHQPHF